jgi:hypothetical protein
MMPGKPIAPAKPRTSTYNFDPSLLQARGAELPGIESVQISELFPDSPVPVPTDPPEQLQAWIRDQTQRQLARVDLSKIGPHDSVNILASHHGFTLYGGEAYAQLIRTVKDEVERRCGTQQISFLVGGGLRHKEPDEYIKKFALDSYFHGKAYGICPMDEGLPVETDIGTLYALKSVYTSRWIIHTHNNDIREIHYHRQLDRLIKPFSMSYARSEMRSLYHQSMGPRSANVLARAIFNSQLVQNKFVGSVILRVAPSGIIGVSANNDLAAQDAEVTRFNLSWYGRIIALLRKIEDVIVVIDYPGPIPYVSCGGILFGNFLNATIDEFDLDVPCSPFNRYTDMLYPEETPLGNAKLPPANPAIKALVINYCSKGYPGTFFAQQMPTLVVGPQADLLANCEENTQFMHYALKMNSLDEAMAFAKRFAKTPNILVFDGAMGGFNVSKPLAEKLRSLAPAVSKEVDEKLLPNWLKQRGIA